MPAWWSRVLDVGSRGPDVRVVARKLGHPGDVFTVDHAALVRGLQRSAGLPVTGLVDAATAAVLGEAAGAGLVPEWWPGVVAPGEAEYAGVLARLGLDEPAVRRLQGDHGIKPTGVIDADLAVALDRLV